MATRTNAPAQRGGVLHQSISLTPDAAAAAGDPAQDSAPTFWERIYAIKPEEWANYFCYLYRGRGGASLAKLTHPFDADWVKQQYGGGDYRALLNDQNYKMVASHSFSIEGPPKPSPVEAQTAAPAAAPNDAFQAQVLELIRESNRQTQDLVREVLRDRQQPAGYAAGAVDPNIALKGVIEMLVATMPKQQDPLALLVQLKTLMPTQTDPLDFLVKLKTAGLIPDGAAGGTLLEQIEKITEVASKLGLSATGSKSLGEILLEKGPDILAGIGTVVDKYKGVENTRLEAAKTIREVQRNAAPPGVAHTTATPAGPAAPPAIAAPPSSALDVEPIGTPGAPTSPVTTENMMTEADLVKSKIVKAIANGAGGGDIVSFIGVMDEALLDTFRGVSAADLEMFCNMDPILKQATQLPRFKECVQEIVEVLQEEEVEARPVN
ncbi:MAG: hypothetical protein LAO20_14390 [Acidobacteriia bacterium]|nr:hypothetical protein [Terriglobia bacterium]